jgi:hypothetical protein
VIVCNLACDLAPVNAEADHRRREAAARLQPAWAPIARLCRSFAAFASNSPVPPPRGATTTQRFPASTGVSSQKCETQLLLEVRDRLVVIVDDQSHEADPLSHCRFPGELTRLSATRGSHLALLHPLC